MNSLSLCTRCRSEYTVWPATLCWHCRAELDVLEYDPEWSYEDNAEDRDMRKDAEDMFHANNELCVNEPPVDPEDTADIQMLFDEDENDDN